jgi:hypothetical protein
MSRREPGVCPSCGRGDRLDIRIPSERGLLQDILDQRRRARIAVPLVVLLTVALPLPSLGIHWIAQNWLGLEASAVEFVAMPTPLVGFLATIFLAVIRQKTFPDAPTTSEPHTASWAVLPEEPVSYPEAEPDAVDRREAARQGPRHKL